MQFPYLDKIRSGLRFAAAMEVLWLVTILAVPIIIAPQDSLIFNYQLPKIVLLRGMVSLMAVLWLLRWLTSAASPIAGFKAESRPTWNTFRSWIVAQPVRLLAVGVLAFVVINLFSAMLSVSSDVSVWGGFKALDGYGLHNVLMFGVLFWVVASNVTTRAQVWRLLGAVAASGGIAALIGVLQRIDIISAGAPATSVDGISSTFGNPDVFGAYLVITIPVTVGLAATRFTKSFSFGEQALWVLLVAVQILAVAFTLSLGSVVGVAVALIALIGFGYFVMEQTATIKVVAITAIAVSITFLGMSFAPDLPEPAAAESESQLFDETQFLGRSSELEAGYLAQRQGVWATSVDLILSRPSLPSQGGLIPGLRFLLGYGPDTYSYVFPLEATGETGLHSNAENELIHRTVELGVLGGISLLALYVAAITVIVWLLARRWEGITKDHKMVLVLITAVLVGRLFQQMLHLGGVGDAMLFWVFLALIPAVFRAWPASTESQSFDFRDFPASGERPAYLLGARIALALALIASMGWIYADRSINIVRADNVAADAQLIEATEKNRDSALALYDEAIDLAPNVPNYYRMRGDFLVAVNETVPKGLESNSDLEEIYADRAIALQIDPLAGESLLDMANSAFDLTRAGYEGLDAEAVDQYMALMALSPNFTESHSLLWTLLAVAYMDAGQLERSLDFLEIAVGLESSDFTHAKALFVQGAAFSELGQVDNAMDSLLQVLEVSADNLIIMETHRLLATVYSRAGEPQLSSDHYEQFVQMRDANKN